MQTLARCTTPTTDYRLHKDGTIWYRVRDLDKRFKKFEQRILVQDEDNMRRAFFRLMTDSPLIQEVE